MQTLITKVVDYKIKDCYILCSKVFDWKQKVFKVLLSLANLDVL